MLFSCKQPWTQREKEQILGGCMKESIKDMGEAKARVYCSCMLGKLQSRYPNARDLKYIKSDTALYSMGQDCLQQR